MTQFQYIIKSFRYYFKANLWVALGVAISTAVLTGALIVGDSVKYSLKQSVELRLGKTTQAVTSGERFFTQELAVKLNKKGVFASANLHLEGIAQNDGGQLKLNNVQVWGIDDNFFNLSTENVTISDEHWVGISQNVAVRLNLSVGDVFMLRINKGSLLPANAPFVSDEDQTVATQLKVAAILTHQQMGRLSLQSSQNAPFNIFIPISKLNTLSEMQNRANVLLLNTNAREDEIKQAIKENFSLSDAGLDIIEAAATGEWELRSGRVFMDETIHNIIEDTGIEATPILTYFANRFEANGNVTPYSFVSTLPNDEIAPGEIIINAWLATDLNASIGDSIKLFYYEIGPLRELTENSRRFTIKRIEGFTGYFSDRLLMPEIPGLSDAENCRDWQTGVPVDLKTIRKTDEDYWYKYRGTPKAFIAFSQAEQLWSNRFGNATAYRFSQNNITKEELEFQIMEQLDPFAFDLQLKNVKIDGLNAAKNGSDFSSLFLGLSFFIIVAALLLTSLFFAFNIEQRSTEIGTLSALGFKQKTIKKLFLAQGLIVALVGSIIGIFMAFVYNELIFFGLNKIWNEIVRTDLLISHYKPNSLFTGLLISLFISIVTIYTVLTNALKQNIVQLQRKQNRQQGKVIITIKKWSTIILTAFSIFILLLQIIIPNQQAATLFFIAGGALLLAFILGCDLLLTPKTNKEINFPTLTKLAIQNLKANKKRSLLVIVLLAIGTFLVVSTGMNRKDLFANATDKSSGTGGFLFWAESTVPLLHNLNNNQYRKEQSYSENFSVVHFSVAEGDDASCLNLNQIANPRILGVNTEQLYDRFSFETFLTDSIKNNPWKHLKNNSDECIPAIADQTVILWSLGKKVGDTLLYKNSRGEDIKLRLIAGTSASVFQGNVIIDQQQFLKHFPTTSGSSVFLIDGESSAMASIADELNLNLRDNGWELIPTAERLAMFKSVENTYLSIFLVLGALGLLIGTIGLAVVLLRSMLSRKAEFAILQAVGISQKNIFKLVTLEFLILLFIGIIGGFVTAFVAVYPTVASSVKTLSPWFVVTLTGLILINGLAWIGAIAYFQLKKMQLVEALRND